MDGYDSFINDYEEDIDKGNPNKEGYQGPTDSPEIYEIIDQNIRSEVVPPDRNGEKLMGKVNKRVRYDDTNTGECNYNAMHDKSLYEVETGR